MHGQRKQSAKAVKCAPFGNPVLQYCLSGLKRPLVASATGDRRDTCLLQRLDGSLGVGRRIDGHTTNLTEPALNQDVAAWRQIHRRPCHKQRDEDKSEQRKQEDHAYTSILMTLRIQT